jgi:hypothetical protein
MAVKTFAQVTEHLNLSEEEVYAAAKTGKAPSEVTEADGR